VNNGKVFRIGTVRYNWPMSACASQAFSIAHCTDSEDLPKKVRVYRDLGYLATFSNPAVQLFSCKYVTIKLSLSLAEFELSLLVDAQLIRDLAQLPDDPIRSVVLQYLPPRPEESDTLCPAPWIRLDPRVSLPFCKSVTTWRFGQQRPIVLSNTR